MSTFLGDPTSPIYSKVKKNFDMSQKLAVLQQARIQMRMTQQGVVANIDIPDDRPWWEECGIDESAALKWTANDIARIIKTFVPGTDPTQQQIDLLCDLNYNGTMNVKDVHRFLETALERWRTGEKQTEERLKEVVEDINGICERFLCPYCDGALKPCMGSLNIECHGCGERFDYRVILKAGWFPKRINDGSTRRLNDEHKLDLCSVERLA